MGTDHLAIPPGKLWKAMLDCEHRIWVKKTSLVARILHSNREEDYLCREILHVQLAMGWPGLISELKDICKKVGLQDVTTKYLYRKEIFKNIQLYDMKIAKEQMKHLDKCKMIKKT